MVGAEHPELLVAGRQRHGELEQEPVQLRLRQRVGALVLDRVLGGGDQERVGQRPRLALDRDLPLLHRLQQRGLRLRRRPVDLVGEQQVGEDRPGAEVELGGAGVEDQRAGDVAGHQVRGELQPLGLQRQRRATAPGPAASWRRPGTPSSSTCPRQSSAITSPVTVASWPTTTLPTSARSRLSAARARSESADPAPDPLPPYADAPYADAPYADAPYAVVGAEPPGLGPPGGVEPNPGAPAEAPYADAPPAGVLPPPELAAPA